MITFIGHCQDSSGNKARKQNDELRDISPYAIYRRKILSYYCEALYDSFNRKAKNKLSQTTFSPDYFQSIRLKAYCSGYRLDLVGEKPFHRQAAYTLFARASACVRTRSASVLLSGRIKLTI